MTCDQPNHRSRRAAPASCRCEPLEPRTLLAASLLKDVNPTPVGPTVEYGFRVLDGAALFAAVHEGRPALYRSDGTHGGTAVLHPVAASTGPRTSAVVGDR